MNCRNDFVKNGEFTISTNFLTRVLTKAFTFILISALLTFLVVTIHASDALCLDTSFGGDGRVTTSFSDGNDVGSGIAVQSDEKIVVVGTSDNGSGTLEFAVARFNIDGSLDTSFKFDGTVITKFSSTGDDMGSGIALQSDDKIVVVGTSDDGSGASEFAVARYLLDLPLNGGDSDGGGGGGGGGCFIATAAYGSPMQPYVKVLHKFCDRFLLVNTVGKGFVGLHHTYSLSIANLIADNDSLRAIVRLSLIPFVGVSWVALKIGFLPTSDENFNDDQKGQKCDLCAYTPYHWDKAGGGPDGKQACVEVCPVGAIKFTNEIPVQKGDKGYKVNLRTKNWWQLGYPIDSGK